MLAVIFVVVVGGVAAGVAVVVGGVAAGVAVIAVVCVCFFCLLLMAISSHLKVRSGCCRQFCCCRCCCCCCCC